MKSLAQIRKDPRVHLAYRDNDGFWIELASGFADVVFDPHQPTFTIAENDWPAAAARMKWVKPYPSDSK